MRLKIILLTLLLTFFIAACNDAPFDITQRDQASNNPTEASEEGPEPESVAAAPPAAAGSTTGDVEGEEFLELSTTTPPAVTLTHPVINEVVVGAVGNNNYEFIELYNPTNETIDLNGWSLWYQIRAAENPVPIYRWEKRTDLPARSYHLLGRAETDLSVIPDSFFTEPLFNKGGLFLRDAERQDIDVVGWGDAPQGAFTGSPAPAIGNGQSLYRQTHSDEQDNAADFLLTDAPHPQNSGEVVVIAGMSGKLNIVLPGTVKPGEEFTLIFIITNEDPTNDHRIFLSIYIPEGFEPVNAGTTLTAERRLEGAQVVPASTETSFELTVVAPYTYSSTIFNGSYIEIDGARLYAPINHLTVAGGSVPIGVARQLVGQTVTVEGVATMYTGGFFAGTTGTKFYIEDETGGIQVYVPDGQGDVNVGLGDRVRVTGNIEPYRTSLELIPGDFTTDIEQVATADEVWQATPAEIATVLPDSEYVGRLITIEGVATRIEEFTYSYEVDLTDPEGHSVRIYLDKLTEATIEPLVEGESYQITGVVEMFDGEVQLQPRLQQDLVQIYPPTLRVEVEAPLNAISNTVPYTISVINNTAMTLTNILVSSPLPSGAVESVDLGDGRTATQESIKWSVPSLAAGERIAIGYTVVVDEGELVQFPAVSATAAEWPEAAVSPEVATYLGDIIPIYAIQGSGFSSPYAQQTVTTEGIITADFPELGGWWLQTPTADDDPATSEGIFVLTNAMLEAGQSVRVTGRVRELSGQTTLEPLDDDAIAVMPNLGNYQVVELQPPAEAEAALVYYEALEGMMVKASNTVAVAPMNHFGEYALVRSDAGVSHIMRNDGRTGLMIVVDDGSTVRHEDASTLPYLVASGDLVSNVVGPLAYTFDQYKIEPLAPPTVQSSAIPLPQLPPLEENQFSVATFNVENLFDTATPHPDDPPQLNEEQYQIRLTKIADTIIRLGTPTIVALQEVENIGILEELAAHPLLSPFNYEGVLVEGTDSRGIDVGYLVRSDRVELEDVEAIPAEGELFSRPPLLIQAHITLGDLEQTVFVLNNHFTSMSAGEEATEPRRDAQAAWNAEIVADIVSDMDEAPYVIVLGDLNSFYDAKPIDTLRAAGLNHVYEFVEANGEPQPYTYIYQGAGQTLDHMLVTPNLFAQLASVTAVHLNADYPFAAVDDLSAQHVSDHDPLVAVFTVEE